MSTRDHDHWIDEEFPVGAKKSRLPPDDPDALAAWLGPWLVEVGLVASSDDPRVEELAELLSAEIISVRAWKRI